MILRAYHFLGIGLFLFAAFSFGLLVRPVHDPPPPVPNDEQRVRMDGALYQWMEIHDPGAMSFDFPTPLPCRAGARSLTCFYGVTYDDESTSRYWVTLSSDNAHVRVAHSKPIVPVVSPP